MKSVLEEAVERVPQRVRERQHQDMGFHVDIDDDGRVLLLQWTKHVFAKRSERYRDWRSFGRIPPETRLLCKISEIVHLGFEASKGTRERGALCRIEPVSNLLQTLAHRADGPVEVVCEGQL